MSVALLLYGSRARGDFRKNSDVDLLSIKADGQIRFREEKRNVTLHEYSFSYLLDKAMNGDLFVLHLVSEGESLADDLGLFVKIKEAYEYKDNYDTEKLEASAVATYCLLQNVNFKESFVKKRLIWAIRTLIIASAAEERKPVFSSSMMKEYSDLEGLDHLINNRNRATLFEIKNFTSTVLNKYGTSVKPILPFGIDSDLRVFRGFGSVANSTPAYVRGQGLKEFWNTFYL